MKSLPSILLISTALLMSPLTSTSWGGSSSLQVSATILPWLKFNAEQHVRHYRVTREDLHKGYVDIQSTATIYVQTNGKRVLLVNCLSGGAERILLKESGSGTYSDSSIILPLSWNRPGENIIRKLDCRIILPSGIKEGVYALNLSMSPQIN